MPPSAGMVRTCFIGLRHRGHVGGSSGCFSCIRPVYGMRTNGVLIYDKFVIAARVCYPRGCETSATCREIVILLPSRLISIRTVLPMPACSSSCVKSLS